MDQNKIGCAAGFNFGPIVIYSIHQYSPKAIGLKAIPILFADDSSILITSPSYIQFQSDLNVVFGQLTKLSKDNLLSFNFDKTFFIQFTKTSTCISNI
jgi:hypothetical protein